MANDKAWDSDAYSANGHSAVTRFAPADKVLTKGLSIEAGDEILWPVTWEQFEAWGGKANDVMEWQVGGASLCYFSINGVRVAKGERGADGIYSWTRLIPDGAGA